MTRLLALTFILTLSIVSKGNYAEVKQLNNKCQSCIKLAYI